MDLDGTGSGVPVKTGPVSPLEMPKLPGDDVVVRARRIAHPMTLATVAQPRLASLVFDLSSVDVNGRLVARAGLRSLGWDAGCRLAIKPSAGLLVVSADAAGRVTVKRSGVLIIPVGLRSLCGLTSGTRVLLAADPVAARLVVYPPGVLSDVLEAHHVAVLGGGL
jgi:hypothetical protein